MRAKRALGSKGTAGDLLRAEFSQSLGCVEQESSHCHYGWRGRSCGVKSDPVNRRCWGIDWLCLWWVVVGEDRHCLRGEIRSDMNTRHCRLIRCCWWAWSRVVGWTGRWVI